MRFASLLLVLLVLLGTDLARADGPPRRVTRVAPGPARPAKQGDPLEASPTLKPAVPPPVTKPALARRSLLEPQIVLEGLGRDIVACFQPQVAAAEAWELVVREVEGPVVRVFEGEGAPPARIPWDGRLTGGGLAWSGLAYTFGLSFVDSSGTARRMAGTRFTLPAYAREEPAGISFLLPGRQLAPLRHGDPVATAAARLERVAEQLDHDGGLAAVRIEVLAPDEATAIALAETVRLALARLLDPPDRFVEVFAGTAAAAPPEGTVLITTVPVPQP